MDGRELIGHWDPESPAGKKLECREENLYKVNHTFLEIRNNLRQVLNKLESQQQKAEVLIENYLEA